MLKLACNCPNCRARTDAQFWAIVAPMIRPTAHAVRQSLDAPTQWGKECREVGK